MNRAIMLQALETLAKQLGVGIYIPGHPVATKSAATKKNGNREGWARDHINPVLKGCKAGGMAVVPWPPGLKEADKERFARNVASCIQHEWGKGGGTRHATKPGVVVVKRHAEA